MKFLAPIAVVIHLLFYSQNLFASFSVSADERASLEKLGISNEKLGEMINQGDFSEIKDKLEQAQISYENRDALKDELKNELKDKYQDTLNNARNDLRNKTNDELKRATNKLNEKRDELTNKAQVAASEIIEEADGLIMGYAASTISLTMLGVFAPSVVMACRTKPSALIYAATAAIYLVRELQNSKKFKLSAMAEIEVVKMTIDKEKSINSNLDTAQEALDLQFKYINSYKNILDKGFESLQDKARNARMAALGFMAASGVALAETYAFDAGACVPATANNSHPNSLFNLSLQIVSRMILTDAFANEQITVEKREVAPQIKNNKLLDYATDGDKVFGLMFGGISFAAASFIPWYGNFLKKIVSSGTGRSVVFGAHGAIAFYTGQQLGESSEKMLQRMEQLQKIIDEVQTKGTKVLSDIKDGINSEELNQVGQVLGFDPSQSIGEMSINEADQAIKNINEDDIKLNLEELVKEGDTSFFDHLIQFFVQDAYAQSTGSSSFKFRCYTPEKCAPPTFPRFKLKNLAHLNEFLYEYQIYGTGVYQNRSEIVRKVQPNLEKKEGMLKRWREQGFNAINQHRGKKTERPIDFLALEKREASEIMKGMAQHIRSRSGGAPAQLEPLPERKDFGQRGDSVASIKDEKSANKIEKNREQTASRQISALDYNVLTGLVERLERVSLPSSESSYNFSTIHPKEVSLFEAIHRRYQIVFARLNAR